MPSSAVQRATAENANLPILKNVIIDRKDGGISIAATNLEFAITAKYQEK